MELYCKIIFHRWVLVGSICRCCCGLDSMSGGWFGSLYGAAHPRFKSQVLKIPNAFPHILFSYYLALNLFWPHFLCLRVPRGCVLCYWKKRVAVSMEGERSFIYQCWVLHAFDILSSTLPDHIVACNFRFVRGLLCNIYRPCSVLLGVALLVASLLPADKNWLHVYQGKRNDKKVLPSLYLQGRFHSQLIWLLPVH